MALNFGMVSVCEKKLLVALAVALLVWATVAAVVNRTPIPDCMYYDLADNGTVIVKSVFECLFLLTIEIIVITIVNIVIVTIINIVIIISICTSNKLEFLQ